MVNQEIIIIILSTVVFCLIALLFITKRCNCKNDHTNIPFSEIPPPPRHCFIDRNNYKSRKIRIDTLESLARTSSLINEIQDKSSFRKCIEMELDLIKSGHQNKD